ncbi:ACT domain-containing protein [Sedimentibacter sp. zth1]|uniref:ACT domain-containing protein n=1 Tax=Sedimentibacter sp. zth1 TaxID=2816908 RepID=UPI001A90CF12|nr:ACT domain-containing protein [Sedimentibacter sp. zth1]QSX06056.1 ACT domain-containing protein [Sedimentibacter sp. zth1]
MLKKYLIVNKEILPDVFDKVIEARNYINDGTVKSVSESVKKVGISRSTYYKYKDYVFSPSENSMGRKAVIALMLTHRSGVLSEVLNLLSTVKANILTMNQNIPINGKASVNISIDMSDILISIDDLISKIEEKDDVNGVKLLSIE